jgi:hypothetical protein
MAAKNTLKYKRNQLPPLLDLINDLVEKCLKTLESPDYKATISDLVKLIRFRLKVEPLKPAPKTVRWLEPLRQVSDNIPIRT